MSGFVGPDQARAEHLTGTGYFKNSGPSQETLPRLRKLVFAGKKPVVKIKADLYTDISPEYREPEYRQGCGCRVCWELWEKRHEKAKPRS